MKTYSELKSEMDNLEAQMEEAKKRERAEALKKVKQLCKEFGFTAGMLQGVLAKGRNRTPKTQGVLIGRGFSPPYAV
jgi:DNA-binding protein H-NS